MLPLADGRELAELTARREQRDVGVAEPERCEATKLRAELERQLGPARHDRVDVSDRLEILLDQEAGGVLRKSRGERLDVLGLDREPGRGAVSAPSPEERRARA